jgi:hypothetical protein
MSKSKWGKPPIDLEGNNPAAIGPASRAAYLASNWIIAIYAWDYCDASLLSEMLKRHPIPFELQPVIADIVSGGRCQKTKGVANQKIPAGHRMVLAGLYLMLKNDVVDAALKTPSVYQAAADERKIDDYGVMRRELQGIAADFKKGWAQDMGITVDTLDNMCDVLRLKIKNYPKI